MSRAEWDRLYQLVSRGCAHLGAELSASGAPAAAPAAALLATAEHFRQLLDAGDKQ